MNKHQTESLFSIGILVRFRVYVDRNFDKICDTDLRKDSKCFIRHCMNASHSFQDYKHIPIGCLDLIDVRKY